MALKIMQKRDGVPMAHSVDGVTKFVSYDYKRKLISDGSYMTQTKTYYQWTNAV